MAAAAPRGASLAEFLRVTVPPGPPPFEILERVRCEGYERLRIQYPGSENDSIPAFLLVPPAPAGGDPSPAVLVHHQHNGERHLGKSEVCGLAGNPLQAFGPELACRGFVVLAPDSIAFEDRRPNRTGTTPDPDGDFLQHYNQLAYRLARGETLMRKVLEDALLGTALLAGHPRVDASRVGLLGHSYGGNTVLFQAAVDESVAYARASGSAASYRGRMAAGTGIEMAEVIPGVVEAWELHRVLAAASPRPFLVVSADGDKYSQDATEVVEASRALGAPTGLASRVEHLRFGGGHPLTVERVEAIVEWLTARASTG